MGQIILGEGYYRPGKRHSPTEERFQKAWEQFNTSLTLVREYKQVIERKTERRQRRSRYYKVYVTQYPRFIDFAHLGTKLAIELDGPDHDENWANDKEREWELLDLGWAIRRFTNDEIQYHPRECIATVLQEIRYLDESRYPRREVKYGYDPLDLRLMEPDDQYF